MKAKILRYGDTEKGCDFQEYDKASGAMKACGKRSVASIGKNFLCVEHVVDGLAFSPKLDMEDAPTGRAKFGMTVLYKEDFLKLCKKQDEENEKEAKNVLSKRAR
jgi:phenolic acid decarboxylase